MKDKINALITTAALLASGLCARAQGTAFTYQGSLNDGGSPANGSYSLRFTLYDASNGGNLAAGPITNTSIAVNNGLFSVPVDFGPGAGAFYSALYGSTYWLQIDAAPSSTSPSFTPLAPRQQVTPTPLAMYAGSAEFANTAYNVYNNSVNTLSFNVNGSTPAPGKVLGINSGGGLDWVTPSTSGSSWGLTGNPNTSPGTDFLGTTDFHALELHVNGTRALQIVPTATVPNLIGGYLGNVADNGAQGATIGGGGTMGFVNEVSSTLGTIAGGSGNVIQPNANDSTVTGGRQNAIQTGSWRSFIGGGVANVIQTNATGSVISGGEQNTIQGMTSSANSDSTIAGGTNNIIGAGSFQSTISGGSGNTISGVGYQSAIAGGVGNTIEHVSYGVIGGGQNNTVSPAGVEFISTGGTVPGGIGNWAAGYCSFAAGANANCRDDNSFVWCDGTEHAVSQGAHSFTVFSSGGIWMWSGANSGTKLAAGATSWSVISDRNTKKNIAPVDYQAVLDRLSQVPIQQWNYNWEKDSDVPNIGPMAQDFKGAFYPGRDNKSITTLEFDGVELAAIQGLNQKLEATAQALKARDARIQSLEQRLERLEKLLPSLADQH